jgi:hypothetical protein
MEHLATFAHLISGQKNNNKERMMDVFYKKEEAMKTLLTLTAVLVIVSPVSAVLVSADADGYSDGADICTVFEGITLSSVGGYPGLDGIVYAWGDGLASTGTSVFANNLSFQRQWYARLTDSFALRADFEQPANLVAIDIIGDDAGDYGELYAYNSSGTLIDYVLTPQLMRGEIFRVTISRDWAFDIAYIIAGGAVSTADTVHLDNLTANVIPEPATLLLLGLGSLLLTRTRRKLKQ